MLKQSVTYKDFNGADRTVILYFNLSEFELLEIQAESINGIHNDLQKAIEDEDIKGILKFIKILVDNGYGEKSGDGRFHEKTPEILQKFKNSAAYSPFMMDMFTDIPGKMVPFINGILPDTLIARADELQRNLDKAKADQEVSENMTNPYETGFSGEIAEKHQSVSSLPENPSSLSDEQRAQFEAWMAEKNRQEQQEMTRPPHESGQGFQL